MFWQGKWFGNTRFWRKLSHKNAIKMVWADFMPILTPRLVTIIFLRKFSKKLSHKIAIKMSKGHFSVYLHWNFQVSKVSKVSKVSWDFLKKSRSLVRLLKCETLSTLILTYYRSFRNGHIYVGTYTYSTNIWFFLCLNKNKKCL